MGKQYTVICELNGHESEMKGTLSQFKRWFGMDKDNHIKSYVYKEYGDSTLIVSYTREVRYYSGTVNSIVGLLSLVNNRNISVEQNIGVTQPRYWLKESDDQRCNKNTIDEMVNRTHRSCPSVH